MLNIADNEDFNLIDKVKEHGIDKLKFMFEVEQHDENSFVIENASVDIDEPSDKTVEALMVITETEGHCDKIENNYKVTFKAFDNNNIPLIRTSISNFNKMVKSGNAIVITE